MNSLSTRESTNAEYDPFNMVDALLRANPDAFGDMRVEEEQKRYSGHESGVEDEVRIMGSVEDLKEIKQRESSSKGERFGH